MCFVGYRVWCCFCGVGTLMYNRYQCRSRDSAWCWYWGHVTSIDIEWILIIECWFKLRQCVFSEKPWHPTCVELCEPMILLAMLVLILLVLCAGLWSPRLHKTVSEFIVCLKLFSCLFLFVIRRCLLVPFSCLFRTEYGMELALTCVWTCGTSCVWVMACALVGPKPLPQPQDVILIFVTLYVQKRIAHLLHLLQNDDYWFLPLDVFSVIL